jgi:hypothetical protein
MRTSTGSILALSGALVLASPDRAAPAEEVRVNVGMTARSGGHGEFHMAVCEHYRVEHDVVVVIQRRGIPDDHMPVVFFMAERCRVAPHVIVDMRLAGRSWMDIAMKFHLGADVFYVPVSRVHGPPYGNAFGHFKRPRAEWVALRIPDDDVVMLVHAKFLSERYGLSPDDVIQMRRKDDDFMTFHGRVKAASPKARSKDAASREASSAQGKEHAAGDKGASGKDAHPPREEAKRVEKGSKSNGGGGRGKGR